MMIRFAQPRFAPEQFSLGACVANDGFELDQEVAASIVNAIREHDRSGERGNLAGAPFRVDPTGGNGNSYAPHYIASGHYVSHYRASFEAGEDAALDETVNVLFGRAAQEAFDNGELRERMAARGTALFVSVPVGIANSFSAFAAKRQHPAEALTDGIFTGLSAACASLADAHNVYRRIITDPNFRRLYGHRLQAAGIRASELALPPVVTRRSGPFE